MVTCPHNRRPGASSPPSANNKSLASADPLVKNLLLGLELGNASYVPRPPHALPDLLLSFEKYIHAEDPSITPGASGSGSGGSARNRRGREAGRPGRTLGGSTAGHPQHALGGRRLQGRRARVSGHATLNRVGIRSRQGCQPTSPVSFSPPDLVNRESLFGPVWFGCGEVAEREKQKSMEARSRVTPETPEVDPGGPEPGCTLLRERRLMG